jgi:RNA polymerase sigma factor for flagellar operon FliA
VGAHDLYLEHQEPIERALAAVCGRHRLPAADREEFSSACRLHFLDDDARVLRSFEGRSSIQTFLFAVATRFFLDWRNALWGKWRPSAEARRLGSTAVALEVLLVRDGLSLDEACETLRSRGGFAGSRASLEAMAARFPVRHARRPVPLDAVADSLETRAGAPDARLTADAAARDAADVARVLGRLLGELPGEDRLLVRLRFEEGVTVAEMSRVLGLNQKRLYRRLERLLADLKQRLLNHGVTPDIVQTVLAEQSLDDGLFGGEAGAGVRLSDRGDSSAAALRSGP